MSKFGLYAVNEQKKAGSSTWNLSRLYHDGKDIATVSDPDSFGLRSADGKLNLGGAVIAESADVHPSLSVDNGDIKFGNDVSLGTGKCINITLDDFNVLLQGGSVSGYTKYNPSACYNIVDDVATAEEVTWQPSEYDLSDPIFCKHYHIYNNIVGMDDVYEEYGGPIDFLHPVNTFTAISTKDPETGEIIDAGCPQLGLHYFNNVIEPADTLHIQFHIDTHHMAFFGHSRLGRKFTVYVKDESGELLGQRTVYAGIIRMDLRLPSDANFAAGYHWFSIQAVDDRGVGSIIQFFDFKVKSAFDIQVEAATNNSQEHPLVYDVTAEELASFGIVPNVKDRIQAYRNKRGLSLLYSAVSNTVVKNLETGEPYTYGSKYYNKHYMGVRLPDTDSNVFYFSYKKDRTIAGDVSKKAGAELNGAAMTVDNATVVATNIFDAITLDNYNDWTKTVGAVTYHIDDYPVDIGGVTYFLLQIYEDQSIVNDSNYIRCLAKDGNGDYTINTSVFYDKTEGQFICARKYRIAPLVSGKPVKWIGTESDIITGDIPSGYNLGDPNIDGFMRYYLVNSVNISDGSIESGLAMLIDNDSSSDSYTVNGEDVSIPEGEDVTEWIFKDGAHLYRDGNNKILSYWRTSDTEYVKWDVDNMPEITYTSDGNRLHTVPVWRFMHSKSALTRVVNKVRAELEPGVYEEGEVTLNPWQNTKSGSEKFTTELGTYYVSVNTVDWGTDGYKGGSYCKIPSDFTIDLNGSTIKVIDTDGLRRDGRIFLIDQATNVHVKNGKLDGGFEDHNWLRSRICGTTHEIEQVGTIEEDQSHFCSFENLEINNVLGYEGGSDPKAGSFKDYKFFDKLTVPGYLSFTEENNTPVLTPVTGGLELEAITQGSDTEITDYRRAKLVNGDLVQDSIIDKEPFVGLIHSNDYIYVPDKTSHGVQSPDLMIDVSSLLDAHYDNTGYDYTYSGKRPEVFLHFFDQNSMYLTTIKTRVYHHVKVPANAVKMKITAYGITVKEDDNRVVSMTFAKNKTSVPQAWSTGYIRAFSNRFSTNIIFKNVTWNHTRTIAHQINEGGSTAFINCKFNGVSMFPSNFWSPNTRAIDLEEGIKVRSNVSFISCKLTVPTSYPPAENYPYLRMGKCRKGGSNMLIYACRNFTMAGTSGFSIEEYGGLATSCCINSDFSEVKAANSYYLANPASVYIDNSFDTSFSFPGGSGSSSGNSILRRGTNTYYEPNRANRDDDPVPNRISVFGTFATCASSSSSKYNVVNGSLKKDGNVVAENMASAEPSSTIISVRTQGGKLRSSLAGNNFYPKKYEGYPETMTVWYNVGDRIDGSAVNGISRSRADIAKIRTNLNNYCHTVKMLDISDCTVVDVYTEPGETLEIFCYNSDGAFVKAVSGINAIPSGVKYLKFQVSSSSSYQVPRNIRITVNGTAKFCKNSVPAKMDYVPFRFETRIPVSDEAVEACSLSYDKNTRCVDTGVIMMPENYSIDGNPIPLVLFFHGSTEIDEFVDKGNTREDFKVAQFLAKCGYAVADCSGITDIYHELHWDTTDAYRMEGAGSLSHIEAVVNLVKYIMANYNVMTDGVYVSCKSIGGLVTAILAEKQPFKIKAVGMLSPALSPIISLANHAKTNTDSANMKLHQLGINYTFVKDRFNGDDRRAIRDNLPKLKLIDGFFSNTDLTDDEMLAVVYKSHSTVHPLFIEQSGTDVVVDGVTVSYNLADKSRYIPVPVKIWISEYDQSVYYENSRIFVEMANNGNSVCSIRTFDTSIGGTTDNHSVTTSTGTAAINAGYVDTSGTWVAPTNQANVTQFGGNNGVPVALEELVEFFNQY